MNLLWLNNKYLISITINMLTWLIFFISYIFIFYLSSIYYKKYQYKKHIIKITDFVFLTSLKLIEIHILLVGLHLFVDALMESYHLMDFSSSHFNHNPTEFFFMFFYFIWIFMFTSLLIF